MDPWSAYAQVGLAPNQSAPHAQAPGAMPSIGRASVARAVSPLSVHNPLTWFALFTAATFGLIAASTTVRVGNAKARVSVGK